VNEPSPEQFVADLLPKLRSARACYFPIRHHSPACAAHLQRWVAAHRPVSVLVEGPSSFTSQIDFLIDERCLCPVALYTSFIDKRGRLRRIAEKNAGESPRLPEDDGREPQDAPASNFGPPRFAAFYPFCDYSPELVALRAGRAVGARLRFIDLEFAEMILARFAAGSQDNQEAVRIESLASDPHLLHSEYVRSLGRKLGCRDFNELWDHLFESGSDDADTDAFIDRLAVYCAMARAGYEAEDLRRDGTVARESCMAAAVRDELALNEAQGRTGPILVVTGGFHTVALPDLVVQETARPRPLPLAEDEGGTWLMRYSFDQLDALAGYASGMPSPAYYDRLWQLCDKAGEAATFVHAERVAANVVVEIGRLARERNLATLVSTPDAIAAVQMIRQLAVLRGHPWPLREDMLDGIRSCCVKGEMGTEGQLLMRLVHEVLTGDRVGKLPPHTSTPPIVADFQREARRLRLDLDSARRREITLDLYRNARDRQISRLFHRLDLLGAPFAVFVSGPDFVQGHGLDRMQEHWQTCWSPAAESALIEASIFGPTLEEAAGNMLRQQIARLQDEGQGRSTAAAVTLLVRACRLGLHALAGDLVPLIDVHVAQDPDFASVVQGLSQLELLGHAREPLEAESLSAVPRLLTAAYLRACRLLDELAGCPAAVVEPVIAALRTLREVLNGSRSGGQAATLDAELFHQGLRRVMDAPPTQAQAAIVGAAAGILYGEGHLSEEALVRVTRGYLGAATTDPQKSTAFLRGLLATAREAAWQVAELIRALDEQFSSWDEKAFFAALPELRVAFTGLTPREIARVADSVGQLHGGADLGELVHSDLDEAEVQFGLALTQRVREVLRADGLLAEVSQS
jgi:hypothetical protein